jgi:hypothetical protein
MKTIFAAATTFWLVCSPSADKPGARIDRSDEQLRLLVPAYFYPAGEAKDDWNRMIADGAKAPMTIIVNPASGPGDAVDANYEAVIDRCDKAGVAMLGYVDADYGKRSLEAMLRDVDTWRRLYPKVTGLFLDQTPSDVGALEKIRAVRRFAVETNPAAVVLGNPGVECDPNYFGRSALDAACLFENSSSMKTKPFSDWTKALEPRRVAVIYHTCDETSMRRTLAAAAGLNEPTEKADDPSVKDLFRDRSGYYFATDDVMPMPYGRLPKYWDAEVAAVVAANESIRSARERELKLIERARRR